MAPRTATCKSVSNRALFPAACRLGAGHGCLFHLSIEAPPSSNCTYCKRVCMYMQYKGRCSATRWLHNIIFARGITAHPNLYDLMFSFCWSNSSDSEGQRKMRQTSLSLGWVCVLGGLVGVVSLRRALWGFGGVRFCVWLLGLGVGWAWWMAAVVVWLL